MNNALRNLQKVTKHAATLTRPLVSLARSLAFLVEKSMEKLCAMLYKLCTKYLRFFYTASQ